MAHSDKALCRRQTLQALMVASGLADYLCRGAIETQVVQSWFGEMTELIAEAKRLMHLRQRICRWSCRSEVHFHQIVNSKTIHKMGMRQDRVFNKRPIISTDALIAPHLPRKSPCSIQKRPLLLMSVSVDTTAKC